MKSEIHASLIVISILSTLAFPSSAHSFGGGRQEEPRAPTLETLRMPAHPQFIATGADWSTSGRTLPAYAAIKERRLGNQHWVEFQPSPLAERAIHIIPDSMRIARKADGSPDVNINYQYWPNRYDIRITMEVGLFGRDRIEIERLAIERGTAVKIAEFSPEAWHWEKQIRFLNPVRAQGLVAYYERRRPDQIRPDQWTADSVVTVSFVMDRDEFSEFRKRVNKGRENLGLELGFKLGVIRALDGGATQPSGPEGKVATLTEWVEHQARGAISCLHIARDGEVRAIENARGCDHYWD